MASSLLFGIDGDLDGIRKGEKTKHQKPSTLLKSTENVKAAQAKYRKHIFTENCTTFSEFLEQHSFHAQLIKNVSKIGYELPTKIQQQTIPLLLEGKDVVASAPTGSGKTAAYGLPLIEGILRINDIEKAHTCSYVKALIVTPIQVNCSQIKTELTNLARDTDVKILTGADLKDGTFNGGIDILIATPKQLKTFRDTLLEISWIVVDECDQVFEKSARSSYQRQVSEILEGCLSARLSHSFFSATYDGKLEAWAQNYFDSPVNVNVGLKNIANSFVKQELKFTGSEFGKFLEIKKIFKEGTVQSPVLIFIQSKARALDLQSELKLSLKCKVACAHSNQDESERQTLIDQFRNGDIDILIATNVLSRGVDFPKLKTVINFDIPTTRKEYVHRVGRASRGGRAGGCAITFFTTSDKPYLKVIANQILESGGTVPDFIRNLKENKKATKSKDYLRPKRKPFALPDTVK